MTSLEAFFGQMNDRLAIRSLIDAWAHCADRRLPEQQAELFTPDGSITVYAGGSVDEPVQQLHGHTEMTAAFAVLEDFDCTTHFTGQSTIALDHDTATSETYCLAHHLREENGSRILTVMSIRYLDVFGRHDGEWRFTERTLLIDWIDKRPSRAE